jgi:hypothetical protein
MSRPLRSSPVRHLVTLALLLLAPWAALAADQPDLKKYALLVGCTKYPERPQLPTLRGPANDVPMWALLLTDPKGFDFPAANVTQLAGWPAQPEQRPTYDNIIKGFKNLVDRSGPDVQIFILLSGHGIVVPLPDDRDPLDPRHYKPEGYDEAFLPADVKNVKDGLSNILMDYEIADYLDQMRAKKASVWIVFDCCHAGDMSRDPNPREVTRGIDPKELGFTPEQFKKARQRAEASVKKAEAAGKTLPDKTRLVQGGTKKQEGSVVAFYAAQSYEEAPELPLPEGAKQEENANYYGLFSYSIAQALLERQSPITYKELAQMVGVRYRAARGSRPPTPDAEGDLGREVLGLNRWPRRSDIVLDRAAMQINAGELRGLTPGSVLALHPPAGGKGDLKEVLGYVQVESVTPTSARVKPCAFNDRPVLAADKLEDLCRCEVVSRDFGEMRVKVFADADPALQAALGKLAKRVQGMVDFVPEEAAEWVLRVVTPEQAKDSYNIAGLAGNHVLLLQGSGKRRAALVAGPLPGPRAKKVFGAYPTAAGKDLLDALERDLPKIFKWQNVWRVAGGITSPDGGKNYGLSLAVRKLKDKTDTEGLPLRDGILRDGDWAGFYLKHDGDDPVWVAVFYLDANLGITQITVRGLDQTDAPERITRLHFSTAGGSTGVEGMVVFAIPQAGNAKPDLSFLEQQPLAVRERGTVLAKPPATPFGKLLGAAAFNAGVRGLPAGAPTTPAVLSQSWLLLENK